MKVLRIWLVAFIVFLAVDLLWLGVIAQPIYDKYLGLFLAESINWWAAILFYVLFVVGLCYFAIIPALNKKNMKIAVQNGLLFGFFTYMTYELTNLAVVEGWPWQIVPIDIAWGSVLGCLVAFISFHILKNFQK